MRFAVTLENRELKFFENGRDPISQYPITQNKNFLRVSKVTARPQKKYRYSF